MGFHSVVEAAKSRASIQVYRPLTTLKCEGHRYFRSQAARDLACLLDVNAAVTSWTCMPGAIVTPSGLHVPDFGVFNASGKACFFDASDRSDLVDAQSLAAAAREQSEWSYRLVRHEEMYDGPRLRNVKDLLRYAQHLTPLADRIQVLAAFEEVGTMTVAECLPLFRESRGMAGLASMILRERMLDIDLDEALIGPETVVRLIRA